MVWLSCSFLDARHGGEVRSGKGGLDEVDPFLAILSLRCSKLKTLSDPQSQ